MIHHFFPFTSWSVGGGKPVVSPVNVRSVDTTSELQNILEWRKLEGHG